MTVCANLTEQKVSPALNGVTSVEVQAGSTRVAGKSSKHTREKHHPGHQWLGLQTGYLEMAALTFVLVTMTKRLRSPSIQWLNFASSIVSIATFASSVFVSAKRL